MSGKPSEARAKCENCGAEYIPHPAHKHKTQACDGPNGYCAGVIDGREEMHEQLAAVTAERDAIAEACAKECDRMARHMEALGNFVPLAHDPDNLSPALRFASGQCEYLAHQIRAGAWRKHLENNDANE